MAEVTVDWDVIESVDDIVKVFKKAISRAEPEDEPALHLQEAEAKREFWERKAQRAELDVAKRSALDKYPLVKGWEDEIRGTTPADIEASAKRIHDRLAAREKVAEDEKAAAAKAEAEAKAQAQQGYGQPVGAGGGTPSRPPLEAKEATEKFILDRLQKGDGLQDSAGKLAFARWVGPRIAEAADASIHRPSYRSFSRNAADDKRVQDDRQRRNNP